MTRTEVVLDALKIEIASRRGGRAWCLCPFHDDRSPTSFFVRLKGARAGQSHCFACKRGGSLLALVMHVRDCDVDTARAFLKLAADGFEPPLARVRFVERPAVLGRARFKMPGEVYFAPLAEWVTLARRYAESRGITSDEVERFSLGYAVDGRIGGRIVIPWLDSARRAAGYSARTFCDQEPKYQTPMPDENADRSVMFGEHLWPVLSKRRVVVVTEGALNSIAVCRACDDVAVAALGGSEINSAHAVKLATFKRVVLLTDPDDAGDIAAAQLASMLVRYCEIERPKLPSKLDALDVVLQRGVDALRKRLARALGNNVTSSGLAS